MAKAALKNLDRLKDIINSCEPGSTDMYCMSARTLLRVASQRVLETQHERLGSAQSDYDEADKQVAVCVTDVQCTKANQVLSAARRELNKARLAYMQAISQHMGRYVPHHDHMLIVQLDLFFRFCFTVWRLVWSVAAPPTRCRATRLPPSSAITPSIWRPNVELRCALLPRPKSASCWL
jgi:hypothetical protein